MMYRLPCPVMYAMDAMLVASELLVMMLFVMFSMACENMDDVVIYLNEFEMY